MKRFLKTFGIVFIAELLLILFSFALIELSPNGVVRCVGHIIIDILSLPWMLIDRTYPYYAMEPGWFVAIMVITTLLLHSYIVCLVYKSVKKQPVK